MTSEYLKYAKGVGCSEEVQAWVETTLAARLRKAPQITKQEDVEHVLDYFASSACPRKLKRMSFPQALTKAKAWAKAQQKKGAHIKERPEDLETLHEFGDGSRIVKLLHKRAVQREGFLMSHCVGGYDPTQSTLYSYRDAKNFPHATFEVSQSGGEILQVKGKGNGPIHPKYINPIIQFLQSIGYPVRDSEMRLLGYIRPNEKQLKLLQKYVDPNCYKLTSLLGKQYLVSL